MELLTQRACGVKVFDFRMRVRTGCCHVAVTLVIHRIEQRHSTSDAVMPRWEDQTLFWPLWLF